MTVLKPLGLLSRLSEEDLRVLGECAKAVAFKRDQEVLRQGEQPHDCLYLVQDGFLHVRRQARRRVFLLGRLEPGSFFGEISLFDPGPTTASVQAISDGLLVEIRRRDLDNFLDRRPAAAAHILSAILEEMARRLRQTDERLARSVVWGGVLR